MKKARIWEIFSGVQGEGIHVGKRQVFVRFAGCNLKCRYCDTLPRFGKKRKSRIETFPGSGKFRSARLELSLEDTVAAIKRLETFSGLHHSVSLTGGEPLLWKDFLETLLPDLKKEGFKVFLETNGTLYENLAGLVRWLDIISMDIKLPSVSGMKELWETHAMFLETCHPGRVYVKTVVAGNTRLDEFFRAVEMVAQINRKIPLVIQPVTGLQASLPSESLMQFQSEALKFLDDVRVIPQVHKFLGIP